MFSQFVFYNFVMLCRRALRILEHIKEYAPEGDNSHFYQVNPQFLELILEFVSKHYLKGRLDVYSRVCSKVYSRTNWWCKKYVPEYVPESWVRF